MKTLSRQQFPSIFLVIAGLAGASVLIIGLSSLIDGATPHATHREAAAATTPVDQDPAVAGNASGSALDIAIAKAQAHLSVAPKDRDTWAQLGLAYVQQARVTGDPSYYPKAEGVLQRSLSIGSRTDNWQAMIGMGALANSRHEFRSALSWGQQAEAINSYNSSVYGVQDDALTQLGEYQQADAALQKMLDLQPGIASFTRASYHFEETGRVADARYALQQALSDATDPADIAFCRYYLGELSFNTGQPAAALTQYQQGLAVDAAYDPLLAGKAKAEAALGRTSDAVRDYATVISRVPQPQYVLEYGELLDSLGRTAQAQTQYQLLATEDQLFAAAGVVDDLNAAVVAADHGSATDAVSHAQAEWARRKSVLVADALGWALHRAGRDQEALGYARTANRLGWKNATMRYHLGMIEKSLGQRDQALRDLTAALAINPYFSIPQAPVARTALAELKKA